MNVQKLINELEKIKNKNLPVIIRVSGLEETADFVKIDYAEEFDDLLCAIIW